MNRRIILQYGLLLSLIACLTLTLACSRQPTLQDQAEPWGPLTKDAMVVDGEIGKYGKTLIAAMNQEPRSFNRIVSSDTATADVTDRLFADLIHINRENQKVEPALAKSWEFSADQRTLTMHLRQGVRFSDGQPFSANDVVFTFQVVYDPKVNSPEANQLKAGGQPFGIKKLDDYTVQFTLAQPTAGIERVFDSVFMLPKHKLEASYRAGNFSSAWAITTDSREIVGLGPFKFTRYVPGQRVEMERNPHYWKVDRKGNRLPYLSRLVILVIPNRDTQFLNFQSGNLDLMNEVRADDFAVLTREAASKGLVVRDLGPYLAGEQMWFNQNRSANPKTRRPFVDPVKLRWFANQKFRQAISFAINRKSMVDLVYLGRATETYGPVSASNKVWYNSGIQQFPYDVEKARKLLAEAGFHFATVKGRLELSDETNHPVKFSLMTNAGNRNREKMGALIQSDLEKIGIQVNFTPMEFSTLIAKITESFDYDACLLALGSVDTDPSAQMNVWLSNAPNHQWFPNQAKPTTPWEARLDELMLGQSTALILEQRKKLFDEVQEIVSTQLPFIYLVSRNVLVAAKSSVGNFHPTVLDHHTLWNCEQLYLK
jgi:peptide/nickel transport system substrate-binding protein